jgi:hypothetical protein
MLLLSLLNSYIAFTRAFPMIRSAICTLCTVILSVKAINQCKFFFFSYHFFFVGDINNIVMGRKKRRTHVAGDEQEYAKAPKSFVIRSGNERFLILFIYTGKVWSCQFDLWPIKAPKSSIVLLTCRFLGLSCR